MQKPFYDSKSKSYIQKDIIRDTLLYFILVNPIPFSSFSSPYLVFGLSLISFVRMNRYLLFSSLFSLHERWLLYIFFGTFFFILQHVLENTPYQLYSSFFFFSYSYLVLHGVDILWFFQPFPMNGHLGSLLYLGIKKAML